VASAPTKLAPATMSQSDIYTVFGVVWGEGDPFCVQIQKSDTVIQLKKLIKEENTVFANLDAKFLDLYHVDIPDDKREVLMARVLAESLDTPLLASRTLTDIFSATPPKAATIHFIVKSSKLHG
jgi:hypothetical protein